MVTLRNLIRSRKGTSLIELMVSSTLAAGVILLFGMAYANYVDWQAKVQERVERLSFVQLAFSRLINYGTVADHCDKVTTPGSDDISLECLVEFSQNLALPISFTYVSSEKTLTYRRDYREVWKLPVESFTLCTGSEVKEAGCLGGLGNIPSSVSLDNYFRLKIDFSISKNRSFTAQSGFFLRNSNRRDGVKYVVKPRGGI